MVLSKGHQLATIGLESQNAVCLVCRKVSTLLNVGVESYSVSLQPSLRQTADGCRLHLKRIKSRYGNADKPSWFVSK